MYLPGGGGRGRVGPHRSHLGHVVLALGLAPGPGHPRQQHCWIESQLDTLYHLPARQTPVSCSVKSTRKLGGGGWGALAS
jgi:hypothetical protein